VSALRERLLGAWQLQSFITHDLGTGEDRHPLGHDPRGLITYTSDGFMSAQLAKPDMSEYVAYGGLFTIDEVASTVSHEVTMSTMPEFACDASGSPRASQRRSAGAVGDDHPRGRCATQEHIDVGTRVRTGSPGGACTLAAINRSTGGLTPIALATDQLPHHAILLLIL
jgi:hypothetical protein